MLNFYIYNDENDVVQEILAEELSEAVAVANAKKRENDYVDWAYLKQDGANERVYLERSQDWE